MCDLDQIFLFIFSILTKFSMAPTIFDQKQAGPTKMLVVTHDFDFGRSRCKCTSRLDFDQIFLFSFSPFLVKIRCKCTGAADFEKLQNSRHFQKLRF